MLGQDEMRAWYGPDHVRMAVDRGAVGALLISDDLFRYVLYSSSACPGGAPPDGEQLGRRTPFNVGSM